MPSYAVSSEHQQREDDALSELRDPEYVLDAGKHWLYHLCLAAGCLDLVHGTLAELVRADRNPRLEFTNTEDLYPVLRVLHEPLLHHCFRSDRAAQRSKITKIYDGVFLTEDIGKSPFGKTTLERHLTAFESRPLHASGTGFLTLVAL